jgi:hypothetical protein
MFVPTRKARNVRVFGREVGEAFTTFQNACNSEVESRVFAHRVGQWLHGIPAADRLEALSIAEREHKLLTLRHQMVRNSARLKALEFEVSARSTTRQADPVEVDIGRISAMDEELTALKEQLAEEEAWHREHWPAYIQRFGALETLPIQVPDPDLVP